MNVGGIEDGRQRRVDQLLPELSVTAEKPAAEVQQHQRVGRHAREHQLSSGLMRRRIRE